MDIQFKDKNGNSVQEGDLCHFFWNPILNEDSEIFEFESPIVYIPDMASFGFVLESKSGEQRQISLWALANYSEFGFEKVN